MPVSLYWKDVFYSSDQSTVIRQQSNILIIILTILKHIYWKYLIKSRCSFNFCLSALIAFVSRVWDRANLMYSHWSHFVKRLRWNENNVVQFIIYWCNGLTRSISISWYPVPVIEQKNTTERCFPFRLHYWYFGQNRGIICLYFYIPRQVCVSTRFP